MWSKLKQLWIAMCVDGMKLPYAHDPVSQKPSITIMFPYLMGVIAIAGHIALFFKEDLLTAVMAADVFWTVTMVIYRLRKLDKIKFNLEERSVEIEGEGETEDSSAKKLDKGN